MKVPAGLFTAGIQSRHSAQVTKLAQEFGFVPEAFVKAFPEEAHLLPDFYLSKFPVTNQEYLEFTRATRHSTPEHWLTGRAPFLKAEERLPVVNVSIVDADAFCKWLGTDVRLPTGLEWEKASRGTDGRLYPWGSGFDSKMSNSSEASAREIVPVDSGENTLSAYGICGMVGNVWEWVHSPGVRGGSFRFRCELYGLGCFAMEKSAGKRDADIGFRCVKDE